MNYPLMKLLKMIFKICAISVGYTFSIIIMDLVITPFALILALASKGRKDVL